MGGAGGMLPAVLQLGESKEREVEVRRWVGAVKLPSSDLLCWLPKGIRKWIMFVRGFRDFQILRVGCDTSLLRDAMRASLM